MTYGRPTSVAWISCSFESPPSELCALQSTRTFMTTHGSTMPSDADVERANRGVSEIMHQ